MVRLVQTYPLPKLDDIQIIPTGENLAEKRDRLCELLRVLPPGLTQIVARPAVHSRGLEMLTSDWQQRVWDAQVLKDKKVKTVLEEEEIILTNWREIMRRFDGEPTDLVDLDSSEDDGSSVEDDLFSVEDEEDESE